MSLQNYDVIVVGLGAAGVTAAATLGRAGRRVLGLEAQDRIGGRVHTVPFGEGLVELGAEWVHGSHPSRIYDVAIQHNKHLVPQDLDMIAYLSNGMRPDEKYQKTFIELVDFMFINSSGLPGEKSEPTGQYVTRKLMEYLKDYYPKLLEDKVQIAMLLEFMNQMTNNYNASNDWNEVDSQSKYEELKGHQHLSWHKYGYKTFFDLLLNKDVGFPTLDIKLNTEVSLIEWPQNPSDKVRVRCTNGSVYTALHVIVTVSLGVLKERHTQLFSPQLPKEKVKAIEAISMGVMNKIDLSFDEIWWPLDAVFFCFLWREEDKKQVQGDWITKVFAASRPMGSKNVLTLWTSGEVGKMVEQLPLNEIKRKCSDILQRFMGGENLTVPEPIAIKRSTWYSNPYTRGSYSFDSVQAAHYPNAREDLAAPLLDKDGKSRVFFAGEATDPIHFSTVHGASDTGYKAAMKILPSGSKL